MTQIIIIEYFFDCLPFQEIVRNDENNNYKTKDVVEHIKNDDKVNGSYDDSSKYNSMQKNAMVIRKAQFEKKVGSKALGFSIVGVRVLLLLLLMSLTLYLIDFWYIFLISGHWLAKGRYGNFCEKYLWVRAGGSEWTIERRSIIFFMMSWSCGFIISLSGDLILSVNSQPFHGLTHNEAIAIFKAIKSGQVEIIVGRRENAK